MARLRFVGRPGRRFGNKDGLRYVTTTDLDPKTQLLANVHRGLREFFDISGDSDEEDFLGFTEDDVRQVIKKTSGLLTLVKLSTDAVASSVEEISGRLRQRVNKTTAKPFLQLVKPRFGRRSFLTSTPLTSSKKQDQKPSPISPQGQSSHKPMKGSIKVRLLGKGFLLKKREKKVAQLKEKQLKEKQAVAVAKSSQVTPRIQLKTVGKSVKEAILKKRGRFLKKRKAGRRRKNNEVKYRLVEKRHEKVNSEVAEVPPKKTLCVSLSRHRAVKIRKGMLGLKRKARKYSTRLHKDSENEEDAEDWTKSFHLPSESSHSQRKITANKRFLDNAGSEDVSAPKKRRLRNAVKVEKIDLSDSQHELPCKDVIENPVLIPPTLPISSPSLPGGSSVVELVPDQAKKIPMFDAPLICDSKRMRKPSQKLIMELSEDFSAKKSKKFSDSTSPSAEHSSETDPGEFTWPLRKSAKLTVMDSSSQRHRHSVQRAKRYLNQSLERKADISGNEIKQEHKADLSLPILSTTGAILSQKNSQLGRSLSEVTGFKKNRKKKCCCICDGTYRLSHHIGCRSLCCRSCSRFFKSKAEQSLKGALEPECLGEGNCVISWKTDKDKICMACRYKKCLDYFPTPEEVVNFKSVRKCDIAKRDKHSRPHLSAASARPPSPWTAELAKFINTSSELSAALDTSTVDGNLDLAISEDISVRSTTDISPNFLKRPSRRLCRLGKGKGSTSIKAELNTRSFGSPSTLQHPGGGFGSTGNIVMHNQSGYEPVKEEVLGNKAFESKTCIADLIPKSETRLPNEGDLPVTGLDDVKFYASPKVAGPGVEASPRVQDRFGSKQLDPEEGLGGGDSDASDRKGDSKGPRIKHVCRKAAVVLGKQPATFQPRSELCLSALPSQEKERILQHDDNSHGSSSVDEVKNLLKEKAKDTVQDDSPLKKSIGRGLAKRTILSKCVKRSGGPKKTLRCKKCIGCLTPECGVCAPCKDMPKHGGRGTMKHACILRVCKNPILPWHKLSPEKLAKAKFEKELEVERKESLLIATKLSKSRLKATTGFNRPRGRPRMNLMGGKKYGSKLPPLLKIPKVSAAGEDESVSKRLKDKLEKNQGISSAKLNSTKSKTSLSEPPSQPTIKVDYSENVDIETAWKRGMALLSLTNSCIRAACRLCGSLGQQELVFCSVCCEPFHSFCLDEKDRPREGCDTWCCLQCQFCHVCYGQNNLLQCDKCQESYHPECLGPNYPTKPSRRKRIWVCSKCVRCRSCGATTPGPDKDATWMFDFSLCYACGVLMEKGNFCPVCQKCYTDDDWESQMIQCSTCHSWVHSRCEELTDEMYQILAYMPEDVPFNCRVCCPDRSKMWEALIRQEMQSGMKSILDALMQFKTTSLLEAIKDATDIDGIAANEAQALESGDPSQHCEQSSVDRREDQNLPVERSEQNASDLNSHLQQLADNRSEDLVAGNSSSSVPNVKDVNNSDSRSNLVETANSQGKHVNLFMETSLPVPGLPEINQLSENHLNTEPVTRVLNDSPVMNATERVVTNDLACSENGFTGDVGNVLDEVKTSSAELCSATLGDVYSICKVSEVKQPLDARLRSLLQYKPSSTRVDEPHKNAPRDFHTIQAKLEKEKGYRTIEEFVADIARIIRYNMELKDDISMSHLARAGAAVRTIFVKQMEKCFPWFNVKNSRCWSASSQTIKSGVLDQAVMPPYEDHCYAHWLEKKDLPPPLQPSMFRKTDKDKALHFGNAVMENNKESIDGEAEDVRCCALCWTFGDADEDEAGRLVCAGQDDWVHVNCGLWSAEVYEDDDGKLQNVHLALARSRKLRCDMCGKLGATVGCCQMGCNANFHFVCARRKNCAFLETKNVFCELHWMSVDAELIADGNFAVHRRISIGPSSNRCSKRQWSNGVSPASISVIIGSLLVESLGHLSSLSDTKTALLPVDFLMSRLFWSTTDPRQRSVYSCRITEVIPKAKAPEVIDDLTVVHDENDPRYDAALAMSFTCSVREDMSDQSTVSADEDFDVVSDTEIGTTAQNRESGSLDPNLDFRSRSSLYNSHQDPAAGQSLPTTNLGTCAERKGKMAYASQIGLSNSYPERLNKSLCHEGMPQQRLSRSASDNFYRENKSQAATTLQSPAGLSKFSDTTLKMLGIRNKFSETNTNVTVTLESQSNPVDDNESEGLQLVKIATRLNQAAAKNKEQESQKRLRDENGGNSTEMTSRFTQDGAENEGERSQSTVHASSDLINLSQASNANDTIVALNRNLAAETGGRFITRMGKVDGVVTIKNFKPFVQMDGLAGESDLEDCDGEDLDLVADFSSDSGSHFEMDESRAVERSSIAPRSSVQNSLPMKNAEPATVEDVGRLREGETLDTVNDCSDVGSQNERSTNRGTVVENSCDSSGNHRATGSSGSSPKSSALQSSVGRNLKVEQTKVLDSDRVRVSLNQGTVTLTLNMTKPGTTGTQLQQPTTSSAGTGDNCDTVTTLLKRYLTKVNIVSTAAESVNDNRHASPGISSVGYGGQQVRPMLIQTAPSSQGLLHLPFTSPPPPPPTPPRIVLQAPSAPVQLPAVSPQVQFALSQLIQSNNVSYLGSFPVTLSNPCQLIGNLQFARPMQAVPVVSSTIISQPVAATATVRPVSFGASNTQILSQQLLPSTSQILNQQLHVTQSSPSLPPQVLKSLQQIISSSKSSQPVFFKLTNQTPIDQSNASTSLNSASLNQPPWNSNPVNQASSVGLPSASSQLHANEFNRNLMSAIPLYAGNQVRPENLLASSQPVSSGFKRQMDESITDPSTKRFKAAASNDLYTGGESSSSNSSTSGHRLSPPDTRFTKSLNSSDWRGVQSTNSSDRVCKDAGRSKTCNDRRGRGIRSKRSPKKPRLNRSSLDPNGNSDDSLSSRVLVETNRDEEDDDVPYVGGRKNQQKTGSFGNKKSKPEPLFEPHPMFRPHLPEAEVEEEIENSPLLAMFETEEQRMKDEAQKKKNAPHLMFEITSDDGFRVQADSLNKAWKAVTDKVQDARLSAGMKPVSFIGMNGLYMTQLNHPAIVYLVEQLPGIKRFHNYELKYHPARLDEEDDEIIENPHGCLRAEPFSGRNKCEMFSFLLSRYRIRPEYDPNATHEENIMANKSQRRCTSLDLPMAMRFRHLRTFAKEAVGVYRSNIHGRGLFCKRDIDAGEMIIEYSGEVIRAILTDKREKHYESKAMGCYMFRKDHDHVIDSTMMGNAARFINHSCDPNCYSKVILVENRKHIVIFALRAIRRGEELTYDYKFPIEDVKIPCTCGSRRCRKYLN